MLSLSSLVAFLKAIGPPPTPELTSPQFDWCPSFPWLLSPHPPFFPASFQFLSFSPISVRFSSISVSSAGCHLFFFPFSKVFSEERIQTLARDRCDLLNYGRSGVGGFSGSFSLLVPLGPSAVRGSFEALTIACRQLYWTSIGSGGTLEIELFTHRESFVHLGKLEHAKTIHSTRKGFLFK